MDCKNFVLGKINHIFLWHNWKENIREKEYFSQCCISRCLRSLHLSLPSHSGHYVWIHSNSRFIAWVRRLGSAVNRFASGAAAAGGWILFWQKKRDCGAAVCTSGHCFFGLWLFYLRYWVSLWLTHWSLPSMGRKSRTCTVFKCKERRKSKVGFHVCWIMSSWVLDCHVCFRLDFEIIEQDLCC